MNPSYGWKEYLSNEVIPDTEDDRSLLGDLSPVYFPFSMSETLPAWPEECGLGATESEELGESVIEESPSPPSRPPIYRRHCLARMKMYENPPLPLSFNKSSDFGQDFDLLCYESWGIDFLSEESPKSAAETKEFEANLEDLKEDSDGWWRSVAETKEFEANL